MTRHGRQPHAEVMSASSDTREIIFPHDPAAEPLSGVRNVLLQASLGELKKHGYYERYAKLIDPSKLEQLIASVGPSWISAELAISHYEACDNMMLSEEEFAVLGQAVGDHVQDKLIVSNAKRVRDGSTDLWQVVGQAHRTWARLYQGGSTQVVKVGANEMLLECRDYRLHQFYYFRRAQLSAIRIVFESLGVPVATRSLGYRASRDETTIRVTWE